MWWRTVRRVAAVASVGLVVAVAVAAVGIAGATGEVYPARDASAPPAPVDSVAVPAHDPGKPTAVVVLASERANAADVLAPYEVLASTGAFNLYTVAPQRQPVPLTGGLDLVPVCRRRGCDHQRRRPVRGGRRPAGRRAHAERHDVQLHRRPDPAMISGAGKHPTMNGVR